ncbi:MAG TPA: rhodanese-like domain-containing protein [Phycisphaerales bacterium]|nr:rhodanese-like domain-containing protein [Phycisphaerales bacterium]
MPVTAVLGRACIIAFAGILIGGVVSVFHKPLVTGETSAAPIRVKLPPTPAPGPETTPATTPGGSGAGTPEQAPVSATPAEDVITGPDITIPQAFRLFSANVAFIDARRRDEFEAGHVQNAFWMPADTLTGGKRSEAMDFLVPDQPVVIYCGGGECDASKNVAALLQQGGFTQCLIMTDGYPGWVAAGHPTATGKGDYEMNPPTEGGH